MKIKIILFLLTAILSISNSYASFPVVKATTSDSSNAEYHQSNDEELLISPAIMASEKSQGVALVLLLTLGLLAGHRWYLGTPWIINLFFILTLGGLGVWALVDLIRIITKDLTPARGRYKRSFF